MKQFFKQLIDGLKSSQSSPEPEVSEHQMQMAACAIFLEMAATDQNVTDDELSEITNILKSHYKLTDIEVQNLMNNASLARKNAIDLYGFTRIINENYTYAEKLRLIEQIWRIVFADGKLDMHEDHLVHKLSKLMHIKHSDLISAKLTIREQTT